MKSPIQENDMSTSEPFAPREFNPEEVMVPPPAHESFRELLPLGGAALWLCACFTLGHALILWDNNNPGTWVQVTGDLAGAIWQPVLGTILLLQNLGSSLSKYRQRFLSLTTWALFGWGGLLLVLDVVTGYGTSQIYQRQTDDHSVAEVLRSTQFRQLRTDMATASPDELKRLVTAAGVVIPANEPLPEAPRILREYLINLTGLHEEALDTKTLEQLQTDHAATLLHGMARVCAGLAAATMAILVWTKSVWIRMLRD